MRRRLLFIMTSWIILFATGGAFAEASKTPNIVVILTDDQGYADISYNPLHPKEVSTPNMDSLVREGVFFNQGYISGQVCSPTRAGLMLGRYQQRVGVYTAGDGGQGFDPRIPLFPCFLPDAYRSTAIGKWHLGLDDDYPELKWHAMNRGFDECFKFMGRGAHDYYALKGASGADDTGPIYRNKKRIDEEGYLTTRFSEEAVAFIDRNKERPFFLYLAYNAVHFPKQAPQTDIDRFKKEFPDITEDRAILMAMLYRLDLGIGSVVRKLKDEGLFDNTIVFFLTDNGGSKLMEANNAPLRGFKQDLYEGGIRTPFSVSWPARFKGGRSCDTPVISLDILPTVLDALGVEAPDEPAFDGKSMLPLLTGKTTKHHDTLYFCSDGVKGEWAVRRGDWKLYALKAERELFNLADDPSETTDLKAKHPDKVKELSRLFDAWIEPMPAPIVSGVKRWAPGKKEEKKALTDREKERQKIREEKKKARKK